MFEEMVISSPNPKKTNKPWTVVVSMLFQVAFLGILILIPLIYTEALPKTMMATMLTAPPPPPPPPPPPAATQVVHVKPQAHLMDAGKLMAPKVIPKEVKIIKEDAEPDMGAIGMTGGVPGGVAGGSRGGVLGGVIGGMGGAPPKPKLAGPLKVGGNVQAARIVNRVQPVYPPLARQTRISGTVRLHAIIGQDGTIQSLEVLSGHPLLQQAALDAVRQWRYQPTLLNGDPVEVDTTIDVIFALNEGPRTSTESASPSTPQPPIDPQLKAEILRLFDVMHLKEQTAKTSDAMVDSLRPMMQAVLPVTPNREKIADAYVKDLMTLLDTQEFTDRTLGAYAKYFSGDDIKGLIQFYQTPAGQHFAEAMAPLFNELNQVGQQMAMEHLPEIFRQLCKDYPELQGKAKFCPISEEDKKSFLLIPNLPLMEGLRSARDSK